MCACMMCVILPHRQEEIVPFFQFLENNSNIAAKVLDSSISQTTLEEVFLNVSQGGISKHMCNQILQKETLLCMNLIIDLRQVMIL